MKICLEVELSKRSFFYRAKIGEQNERKACLRMAMASDGDSGFAFQPEFGKPEDSTGQLLARALLGAIRVGRFVPSEVRVRHREFKILLSTLSERIGLMCASQNRFLHWTN